MVNFHGWSLPVQYKGLKQEHLACRNGAGIFDVSHMGEFLVAGLGARGFLNYVTTNDLSTLTPGKAQYSLFPNSNGGIVDDLLVYCLSENEFFLVVNASNVQKDFAHLNMLKTQEAHQFKPFELSNRSSDYSQIALQGPLAESILKNAFDLDTSNLKPFCFIETTLASDTNTIVSRTGYTGEDGFEIYSNNVAIGSIWNQLLETGLPVGLEPCGLGARDTLRLEARLPLYGQELGEMTNPYSAGLGWVVKPEKGDFWGKSQIIAGRNDASAKKLVGLAAIERGIFRTGCAVESPTGESIGTVTSGTYSPSLEKTIALAYLPTTHSSIGSEIFVVVRDKKIKAEVVKTPFYKRS